MVNKYEKKKQKYSFKAVRMAHLQRYTAHQFISKLSETKLLERKSTH